MANEQNLKHFQKGHKLSKGKPKGARHLSTVLKEMLAQNIPTKAGQKPATELIVIGIIKKAIAGDVAAFREIMDRTEGKPVQPIKSEGTLDVNTTAKQVVAEMTTEQIMECLRLSKVVNENT